MKWLAVSVLCACGAEVHSAPTPHGTYCGPDGPYECVRMDDGEVQAFAHDGGAWVGPVDAGVCATKCEEN